MKCPRCETTTLDEKDREGVVVDVCAQCRGIWLDRGELEKLISRAARDLEEIAQQQQQPPAARAQPLQQREYPPPEPPRSENYYPPPRHRRDSDPDYYHHNDPRYRHKRKKSFIESLGDIFD